MPDTAPAAAPPDLGVLPEWDLADLYAGPDDPRLAGDMARAAAEAADFAGRYRTKIADLDGTALAEAIAAFEGIEETLTRIMSYASLRYAEDLTDPDRARFNQDLSERVNDVTSQLLFFTLEINRLDEDAMAAKLDDDALWRYAPWLRNVRAFRDHQLDESLETLLHEKAVAGRRAWTRLFEETVAALTFTVDGRTRNLEGTLDLLSDPKPAIRKAAAEEVGRVMGADARTFALITNTLAKDKAVEDKWRKYPRPVSERNLGNQVEDAVVDTLVASVKAAYPRLSHRYYALKARWLGKDRLDYWDRNAPLPDADDRRIQWDEARAIVLDAYGRFSPDMAEIGGRFFDGGWIDAPARDGKALGAFAHPTVPSVHPYILLNYQGRTRDVMTLAHELGHGVHQVLAGPRGLLTSETPLTLGETASVFGEMLTFRALLAETADPVRRRALLAGKVEDMINTVVRQVAFHEFERHVHDERRAAELSVDRLCEIWLKAQGESLGPAIDLGGDYRFYWAYIPHFVHTPFYVYAYAFGDCLVNSLYAVYEDAADGFAERYIEMLAAGGTKRHRELLAPFGLDASDPAFWDKGLGVVAGLIDELEALDA